MDQSDGARIGIFGFNGCVIFALDLNSLVTEAHSSTLITRRVSGNWIQGIHSKLTLWDEFGFGCPRFAESAYGKTDRAARNTFLSRHSPRLLPLEIPIIDPPHTVQDNFAYFVEAIRLSPQGALTLRVMVNSGNRTPLSAVEVVHNYHSLMSAISAALERSIGAFVDLWNASISDCQLIRPSRRGLITALHSYDIWDYDFTLFDRSSPREVASVKALYHSVDQTAARELTAIANMDISDVLSLREVRLQQFIDSDIGTRDDELWAIGRERMTRRHPERANTYNIAFFADVKLATEILIGYQCTMAFLENWVRDQRESLLDELVSYNDFNEAERLHLQKRYADVIRASQMLVEPVALERGVKHTFFAQIIVRLIGVLGLDVYAARSAQSMSEFASFVESISVFREAELSSKLESIQIELAATSKKIGRIGLYIAIIAAVLTGIQLYLALIPSLDLSLP
ncbi:hypothetical protein ACIBO2_28965 [Nonomuraea sp. NPDC050022]|uniref:hypothetical protein n=1 Tax=unclassified Nonomuraea TaxID=2593643 RepID=UPI0033F95272